jgi:hypothetical protein
MTIPIITAEHVKALAHHWTAIDDQPALVLAEPGVVAVGSVFSGRQVLATRNDLDDLTDQSDWESGMLHDGPARRVAENLNQKVRGRLCCGWFSRDDEPTVGALIEELKGSCPTIDYDDAPLHVVMEGEQGQLDWQITTDAALLTLVVRRPLGM